MGRGREEEKEHTDKARMPGECASRLARKSFYSEDKHFI